MRQSFSCHHWLTNEDNGGEPALVCRGQLKVTRGGREDEGDGEDLDGITGQRPATQYQQTVMEPAITWKHGVLSKYTELTKFWNRFPHRKWQDYVYIQCEYKSTKQKIKHLLREENKVKENKIS